MAYACRPCQLCKDAEAADPVDHDSDESLGLPRLVIVLVLVIVIVIVIVIVLRNRHSL